MQTMTEEQRPNIVADEECTFCLSPVPRGTAQKHAGDSAVVACPCCGRYRITGTAIDALPYWNLSASKWAAIAYVVKKMTYRENPPLLTIDVLRALKETAQLPHPDQILDDFVLWAGSHSRWPGDAVDITYLEHRTLLGAVDQPAYDYMIKCVQQTGCFAATAVESVDQPTRLLQCSLTPHGWQRFRELSTSRTASRYGFMAMKYSDPELDAIVRDHFVPQVKLAGFDLQRLDQGQGAGLIDDQLRLKIRQARFLVCDLTHGNRGAYWEAGYAEGLGVPVIYTCRRDVFDDPTHEFHPHFDAAHWVTVPWDPADPAAAAVKLKITVRATLPAEAQLQD
jgi:hypothetical protein